MGAGELSTLQAVTIAASRRLGFLSVIQQPFEYLYADYGDKAGSVRITSRATAALFNVADERFQWYNRAAMKEPSQQDEQHSTSANASMGISPLPLMRKLSTLPLSSSAEPTANEATRAQRNH
jgi:hypothetical protein